MSLSICKLHIVLYASHLSSLLYFQFSLYLAHAVLWLVFSFNFDYRGVNTGVATLGIDFNAMSSVLWSLTCSKYGVFLVATLGVRFATSCPMSPRGLPMLNMSSSCGVNAFVFAMLGAGF
jgi:hypothetical protein